MILEPSPFPTNKLLRRRVDANGSQPFAPWSQQWSAAYQSDRSTKINCQLSEKKKNLPPSVCMGERSNLGIVCGFIVLLDLAQRTEQLRVCQGSSWAQHHSTKYKAAWKTFSSVGVDHVCNTYKSIWLCKDQVLNTCASIMNIYLCANVRASDWVYWHWLKLTNNNTLRCV